VWEGRAPDKRLFQSFLYHAEKSRTQALLHDLQDRPEDDTASRPLLQHTQYIQRRWIQEKHANKVECTIIITNDQQEP
jgi:hypothetical protein